ncbi:hypothetical protein ACCO45_001502 [Purpureocillium lilacinum]|uniref:Uncharacterized protein n=1 Tax=Purpureocillium lilacinum TaxID=33203 RepID=A0ACC4E839_PURLI
MGMGRGEVPAAPEPVPVPPPNTANMADTANTAVAKRPGPVHGVARARRCSSGLRGLRTGVGALGQSPRTTAHGHFAATQHHAGARDHSLWLAAAAQRAGQLSSRATEDP